MNTPMVMCTRGCSKMESLKDTAFTDGQTATSIKDISMMAFKREKELLSIKRKETSIRETGTLVCDTARVFCIWPMVTPMKATGRMTSVQGLACTVRPLETSIWDSGRITFDMDKAPTSMPMAMCTSVSG